MGSVIYYFSGSGNSYKIAENISERLGHTKLIKISAGCREYASSF